MEGAGDDLLASGDWSTVSQGHNYFDLEVSLDWIQPRIWRRFLLHERATFLDLHRAIQVAFDWDNTHLFAFFDDDGEVVAGVPDRFGMGSGFGDPDPDAGKVPVGKQLRRQWSVQYLYDFGDSWAHSVEVKQVETHDERFTRRLLGGERAGPPEDCGGPPGYEELVAVARGGQASHGGDTEMLREWMGDWDPEDFDLTQLRRRFDG